MDTSSGDTPVIARVRALVAPIASDLGLDLYDVEQRGGTLRITLDTLALASRLVSRELDHHDPMPGHYTLEVTSPGVERSLRTPAHFQREVGKTIAVRLADVGHDERRIQGVLASADDAGITVRAAGSERTGERRIDYHQIDRARTVFEWGANPKPGSASSPKRKKEQNQS